MAFLIPDNLKSRADVTPVVHRVAKAFQTGLDEAVTVWFEPLFDPSGGKPHFIVLIPDQGVVVLEVFSAKEGGRLLGVLRKTIRVERDGREIDAANPLERADQFVTSLHLRITSVPLLDKVDIPLGAGAVFPYVDRKEAVAKKLDKAVPLDMCIFRDDIEAAINQGAETQLMRAFARMLKASLDRRLSKEQEQILRGLIQPETVIETVAKGKSGGGSVVFRPPEGSKGDSVIRVMDRQQESLAKSLGDGHRVIRGVAGSGKTLVLIYRAKLMSALSPHAPLLVTCYTRSLSGQLGDILSPLPNVTVRNLDRVMAETIRMADMKHPGYKDSDGEAVAEAALQAQKRGFGSRYQGVLLDEAQDFSTKALQFAVGLLNSEDDDLLIVADAAQNIFRRKFSWRQAGIHAQGRTRILRTNYRNTRQILEFANKFLMSGTTLFEDAVPDMEDENAVIPPESASRSGPDPTLIIAKDGDDEIRETVRAVKKLLGKQAGPRKVAVLYSASRSGKASSASALFEALERHDIGVFWMTDPKDKQAKDRLAETRETVILTTIHSSKGLEFPSVVLFNLENPREDVETNRKLIYVGMTRAMDHLTVVARPDFELFSALESAEAAARA